MLIARRVAITSTIAAVQSTTPRTINGATTTVNWTTKRNLSFFSNLFGIQPKRLEKPAEDKEKSTPDAQSAVAKTTLEGRGKREGLVSVRKAPKSRKTFPLQEERIIGGNYPVRGPAIPQKRLREWSHTVENLSLGPKKLNLVAKLIRRLPVPDARVQLRFSSKAVSRDVLLALDQACMKARAMGDIHVKDLIVGQCYVGGKIVGHKMDIKARGKSGRIAKKVSHLNIILYENPALVKGFESRTLLPAVHAKQQKQEYVKRIKEREKAESETAKKGLFKIIAD
jgi:large subunit ribosomal protein L22